jgi:hypothetical protein|nr:MAG TPA: hypothetical protein [Caudoviricetes sp.]
MSNTITTQSLITKSELVETLTTWFGVNPIKSLGGYYFVDDEATNAVWIFEFEGDHLQVGDHRSYKTVTTRDELEDFLIQYVRS